MIKIETVEDRDRLAKTYLDLRHRCRTDLLFFINDILAPPRKPLVSREIHGPILDALQKFKGCQDKLDINRMQVVASEPYCSLQDLASPKEMGKQTLMLMYRNSLKTTINIAHKIQWVLNYPDIRIAVSTATGEQFEAIIGASIRSHFQYNERLRWLFPEFCPPGKKAADWGSKTELTVPNRKNKWLREPTFMGVSVGKIMSGPHYDVIWHCDVVDDQNSSTPGQIQGVNRHFGLCEPLLEKYPNGRTGWTDVEGTIYDMSCYYQVVLDDQNKLEPDKKTWDIVKISAEVGDDQSHWPERFPWSKLKAIEKDIGSYLYSCQYRMEPILEGQGLSGNVVFAPREVMKRRMAEHAYTVFTAVDLAGMDPQSKGDYTRFTTAGFDDEGRIDVIDIQGGHWGQDQVVDYFFMCQKRFPQNAAFKIQRDHFVRVLMPMVKREMAKRKSYLRIMEIPIHTQRSKVQRIRALQPWFATNAIRFADDIPCRTDLLLEITRFPAYRFDDILDTLALLLEDEKGEAVGWVRPRERAPEVYPGWNPEMMPSRFLGFGADGEPMWLGEERNMDAYYHPTGI